jgi:hypothetical protein
MAVVLLIAGLILLLGGGVCYVATTQWIDWQ